MGEGEVLEAGHAGQRPGAQRHDLVVGEVERGEGPQTCTQPVSNRGLKDLTSLPILSEHQYQYYGPLFVESCYYGFHT